MRVGLTSSVVVALTFSAASTASTRPSPSVCANAWNHGAPAALRARILARDPRGAFIVPRASVMTVTWTRTSHSSASSSGCSIQFVLGDGHTLAVWGSWARGGSIAKWVGPVPSDRPIPVPSNSSVRADGTVGFHG